jgi:hypothetical protein
VFLVGSAGFVGCLMRMDQVASDESAKHFKEKERFEKGV